MIISGNYMKICGINKHTHNKQNQLGNLRRNDTVMDTNGWIIGYMG